MSESKASVKHPKHSHAPKSAEDFRPSSAGEPTMKRNSFLNHPIASLRGAVLGTKENPTGFAMRVQAIGDSMPKTVAAANRLGEKGRALLERFVHSAPKKKSMSATGSPKSKKKSKKRSVQH